jgi:DNA-directed RNA polymerase
MQELTPLEYLQIDVANCFGLDKETWNNRLEWVKDNNSVLEVLSDTAESPILFRKAVRALRKVEDGYPTNHIMGLDATSSGPQFMAAMSGCIHSAEAVNLVNTGKREDLYNYVSSTMSSLVGRMIPRWEIKHPVMTFFYGSVAAPRAVFGEAVDSFFEAMHKGMPGPTSLMELFQAHWNPTATEYRWVMPDGHHVVIPVTDVEQKGMEIDELDHFRYTYRTRVVKPREDGRALAANIVHSVDAWVCRQMVRRAARQGFQLAPIHDCFFTSPKYMQRVRENYRDLLIEVAERNLVSDILGQITQSNYSYSKIANIVKPMQGMDYHLS